MKIGPFEWSTIYGVDKEYWTPYLTRIGIGRLKLHIFYRGDNDPDPHDHRASFWTFPLRGYYEEIYSPDQFGFWNFFTNYVTPFEWHFRPATYLHRVLPLDDGRWIITLTWWNKTEREWGFRKVWDKKQCWVPWKEYIFGNAKRDKCP